MSIRDRVQSGTGDEGWTVHADGSLRYRGRIVVPQSTDLREEILREFHCSRFIVHPGGTKMYQDLRRQYYWSEMKRHVGDFVRRCLTCQQVKAEHQKPTGLLHSLEVAEWKWEHVMIDFVTHLPRKQQRHEAVWVIVDRLTKSAHFLAVRMTFALERFCRLYTREIVWLQGVLVSIMSDRDSRFTAHFWKSFQKAMGIWMTMSTAFHPQTDGQSERTIQVLEDMLRACVLDHKGSWEEHLPLVEFPYNNSYQASIQMAPYEALYGRPCRSPLCWTEGGESSITGPDFIKDTSEKVSLIRQHLLTAEPAEELCRCATSTLRVRDWGSCLLEGDAKERSGQVRQAREAIAELYWAFRDTREGRHCSVPVGVTAQHVRCPRCISRLHAPEVYS